MKFPSSLKIGAHEYELVFAKTWEDRVGDELGQTVFDDHKIYIKSGLPDSTTFSTVLHEAFHVMNSQLDHVLLDSLAEQCTQFLLDNSLIDEE